MGNQVKDIFQAPAVIMKIATKVDRTFKIIVETQELDLPNETALLQLRLRKGWFLFKESEFNDIPELPKMDKDINQKSPSQRLRAILFRIWENLSLAQNDKTFEQFYADTMENIICHYKTKLNEMTQ